MTQESGMTDKQPQPHRSSSAPLSRAFLYLGLPGLARDLSRSAPEGSQASSNRVLLQVVQPGLAGLMDGSVSTLAPIFAAAFATHRPLTAFLVGMAAATGAGISMAFSEALSDDGVLTGRGNPVIRGVITGAMTFLGGAGHTLPFLVPDFRLALIIAYVVVTIELMVIAAIRHRFFGTRWLVSIMQVVVGGLLVVAAGLIFGNA
jgi:erythrin-vacuolar iron transport family protein